MSVTGPSAPTEQDLERFLARGRPMILLQIIEARGSTPREQGAWMLVDPSTSLGTIGGGALEFHALDLARDMLAQDMLAQDMLANPQEPRRVNIALGPHLGQCCGGHVTISAETLTPERAQALRASLRQSIRQRPQVIVFGAGHTGTALCRQLALLPYATTLIDDRESAFAPLPAAITTMVLPDLVDYIGVPPPRSAFVILTHSHALDYRLAIAALKLPDAAYVGMIGSATKRQLFSRAFMQAGGTQSQLDKLVCPLGGADLIDKRPEIIAALTLAELIRALA